jgi:ubiquinone biosynthesis UbiH/UbiF/VisC/COQ6 family hydroxylase
MALQSEHYDVVVIGAALVGASAALGLAKQGLKVALVDIKAPTSASIDPAVWDSRIYAISPGNVDWLGQIGAWKHINQARVTSIDGMHVWADANSLPLSFDASDAHVESLGVILENSCLHQALWDELETLDVDVMLNAQCAAIDFGTEFVNIRMKNGSSLVAQLIVAADGGNSWVRSQAALAVQKKVYEHVGVVANFEVELPHQNVARQWFVEDGILAWLPLPGNRISMVWSTKDAQHLMQLSTEDLCQFVAKAGGFRLGAMKLITPPAEFPLVKQNASSMIANRLVLVGDAAHQVHPMAGQGVNLGFRDVVELLNVLSDRHPLADIGDCFMLRRYERARKTDVLSMQGLTHGLYGVFDSKQALVKTLREWGLALPNQLPGFKKQLMKHALI